MKFKFDEEKLKINNPDLGVELLTELLDDICLNTRFIKKSMKGHTSVNCVEAKD